MRCHSTNNTDENYKEPPKGAIFETEEQLKRYKASIITQVSNKVMPLANLTQMTEEERGVLISWLKAAE